LFGIPGDTIIAIAIGVLYMKGLNPGPTLFTERASSGCRLRAAWLQACGRLIFDAVHAAVIKN